MRAKSTNDFRVSCHTNSDLASYVVGVGVSHTSKAQFGFPEWFNSENAAARVDSTYSTFLDVHVILGPPKKHYSFVVAMRNVLSRVALAV